MSEPEKSVWAPHGTEYLDPADAPALIVVTGESGVGKSHQVKLLCEDADYGLENVYVALSEPHALTTYHTRNLMYRRAPNLAAVEGLVGELAAAAERGFRVPRVLVWDSASATGDLEFREFRERQPFKGGEGGRDKRAEYGDWGDRFIATMTNFGQSRLPCDVIVLVTTSGNPPELALAGKVVPKNLSRLTSATLHMEARERRLPIEEILSVPEADRFRPHRTFGKDENGNYDGRVVERFLITMNTGEVKAKGHHALNLVEPAVLPNILRKMHGK